METNQKTKPGGKSNMLSCILLLKVLRGICYDASKSPGHLCDLEQGVAATNLFCSYSQPIASKQYIKTPRFKLQPRGRGK